MNPLFIAQYHIVSKLGEDGVGAFYGATDTAAAWPAMFP